jgi:ornithine carbamoyltransferase
MLADLMTIRELKKSFRGLKIAFVGDGNNMANSFIVGGVKMGMQVAIACPIGYEPDEGIVKWAKDTGLFTITKDVLTACKDADVVYTDVWASMGMEKEAAARKTAFQGYQVNDAAMAVAKKDAIVLHCLPAHREEEITDKVMEAHAGEIFQQAENRLHAQKAVLVKLLGKK